MLIVGNFVLNISSIGNIINDDTYKLYATDDTEIKRTDVNYNNLDHINIRNDNGHGSSGWGWDGLIKFDLSSIPPFSAIKSAQLKLYYFDYWDNNPTGRLLYLSKITCDWNEETVTGATPLTYSTEYSAFSIVPTTYGWMTWNVTNDVQNYVNGMLPFYGWKITDVTYWGQVDIPVTRLYTKEHESYVPELSITTRDNDGPDIPSIPIGPSNLLSGESGSYSTMATDPDDDNLRYGWDWDGDDIIDEWTKFCSGGMPVNMDHIWYYPGTYNIRVKAQDIYGIQSDFSETKTVLISGNNPPNIPNIPTGPTNGLEWRSYSYSTSTIDIESDQVYYLFDWGDETTSNWIGPFEIGKLCTCNHTWTSSGFYHIKSKAKDIHGCISDWSGTLLVNIHPDAPNIQLQYPTGGEILSNIEIIRWYATDNGHYDENLPIFIYYSDNNGTAWLRLTDSALQNTGEYSWDTTTLPDGTYVLQIVAQDSQNNIGYEISKPFEIKNHNEPPENLPPLKPTQPEGQTNGIYKKEYSYTTKTSDPNGDQVYYKWDWDDEKTGWLGPYDSGETVTFSHMWEDQGIYQIMVKSKDVHGDESPWSDPLSVTMPKGRQVNPLQDRLEKLIERQTLLHQIILQIYAKLTAI